MQINIISRFLFYFIFSVVQASGGQRRPVQVEAPQVAGGVPSRSQVGLPRLQQAASHEGQLDVLLILVFIK